MIFFFISLSTYMCYLGLKYQKGLKGLQDNQFKLKDFGKWIKENAKSLFLTPELLAVVVIALAVNTNAKVTGICMVIFYLLMFLNELRHKKDKLNINTRLIMVLVTCVILYALVFITFYLDYRSLQSDFLVYDNSWMYYIITIILGYLSYFIILLAETINRPFELLFNKIKAKKGTQAKNRQNHKL